ncbi:MAG: DUF1284 domain-containing protein [Candidatus Omnitrophica bacterium]|nr:DUF1284 domain-containing protein [Candidatus Omnitrophota bacterium]
MYGGIIVSPSEALCLICQLGKEPDGPSDSRLKEILQAVGKNPDIPVTLRCKAGDIFSFQDLEGEKSLSTRRRDLEILRKLDIPPGITLTARILFIRILKRIRNLKNICFFNGKVLCENATKRYYEKSRMTQLSFTTLSCGEYGKSIASQEAKRQGIRIVISPRTPEDLERGKKESLKAMYDAKKTGIRSRPHILLCAVCQYGRNVQPGQAYDNLPEMIRLILKEPDVKITLVEGADWMMCGPCPSWTKENNCVNVFGRNGLSNQLRDMRVLQILGLDYGTTMNGRELYRLIFEKISSTLQTCRIENLPNSMWHDGCGKRKVSHPGYEKARKELMKILGEKSK